MFNNQKAKQFWDNKYPTKLIKYRARPLANTDIVISIPVQLFITPNDPEIIKDLQDSGLILTSACQCNAAILDIYKLTRENFRYIHDDQQFNRAEYWLFPYELRYFGKGDCDDWGVELASYLIAAGVPEWRVRCTVGRIRAPSAEGHLTVHVLADDLETWYHLNSTNASCYWSHLEQAPTINDPDDMMGIGSVWFSMNNINAWSRFDGVMPLDAWIIE